MNEEDQLEHIPCEDDHKAGIQQCSHRSLAEESSNLRPDRESPAAEEWYWLDAAGQRAESKENKLTT